MKPRYIIAIVLIAVGIAAIISLYGNASQYVTFETAESTPGKEFHVIGELVKDSSMKYDPEVDPNHLEFYLKDSTQAVKRVIFNSPKPADLERSEKVVIIGKVEGEDFKASSILLKCPSKYNDGKLEESEYKAVGS
ncbi:MAG: cytochrome c maturation protein CcmE [Bacteroidota bacterium]|nr:cytochrome c maturation protein CcmE [Bacteroidota bacterium]MDX5431615.1 cytochrome c maturation protein CcmE [Bacteroidota bacterium]MDX5470334.1 cytochrome c maturation protein CcmE [Bacteroidota bacterium]